MGLKIMQGENGEPRRFWYARFNRNGKQMNVNLNVPIRGEVPVDSQGRFTIKIQGSPEFERSRQAALKAFAEVQRRADRKIASNRDKKAVAEANLIKASYKVLAGDAMTSVPLEDLPERWKSLKRTYDPTEERTKNYTIAFQRFAKFAASYAADRGAVCQTVNDVTPDIASAYFEHLRSTFAWGTVRDQTNLLSSAFKRWATNGQPNPFGGIIKRNRELSAARINRRPLTAQETERLFELSEDDAKIHPLVICAACTGMRIGDVCNLHWSDIDMRNGLIDCVTAKAGVRVTIPIFTPLRRILEAALADGTDCPFVFPQSAKSYSTNRTSIIRAVKPYFAKAVFPKDEPEKAILVTASKPAKPLPVGKVIDTIKAAGLASKKTARMVEIFIRFKGGEKSAQIAASLGIARGQVSDYLEAIEELTGETYRPRIKKILAHRKNPSRKDEIRQTRQERSVGRNAASLYGWHSLRATFVVLAVESGVALPDIQAIVGHSTVEMTMQYYHPTKKHAAARVARKMKNSVLNTGHAFSPLSPAPSNIPATVWAILTDEQKALLSNKS